jgi:hypothetical protein
VAGKGLLTPQRRVGDGLSDGGAVVAEIEVATLRRRRIPDVAARVEVGRGCGSARECKGTVAGALGSIL